MPTQNFFEKQTPESATKTDIVTNFFKAWLNIIGRFPHYAGKPLAYMEVFGGPGKFDDGNRSTPLLVLEHILASQHKGRFHVILNEKVDQFAERLKKNVEDLPAIDQLARPPIFLRQDVTLHNVTDFLKYLRDFPTVLFVDPWGYKGITLDLFRQFVSVGWGRDAIFFFNYRRINAALSNVQFAENMEAMFGVERARKLHQTLHGLDPEQREHQVYASIEQALHEAGIRFVHRFEFEERGDSLFYICQNEKGYRVMKEIMNKRSSSHDCGIPSNSFSRYGQQPIQPGLFEPPPLKRLADDLRNVFAGRTLTFDQIVKSHHPGTNYVDQNYRDALGEMETRGEITVRSEKTRRAGTFGPTVQIVFGNSKG